ncbi:hypothetical protein ALP29_200399 [Pseudomonas syringae pv. avii]|uniref:Uncharacterized protein n=1 Tax=Pseudomonas syringae pv. avii TaxID=663959 RepID=A0A3M5UWH4_PSESX|nr:hypothetical protein ALP29_200399 [Pseudomonas syringae pv. avii]
MNTAIENIEHRDGHSCCLLAAQILEQGQVQRRSRRSGNGEAHAQDRVSSKPGFIRGSIQLNHQMINLFLVNRIHAPQRLKYFGIHIANGL